MENVRVIPDTNAKYLASDKGRILSRKVNRYLKLFEKNGYLFVDIMGRHQTVHSLVLLAWQGPRPEGLVINHINGDRSDNRLSNLEYCTQSHNRKEDFRMGRQSLAGERNTQSKLTEKEVLKIIQLYETGEYTYRSLADEFDIHFCGVSNIMNGHCWSYLTGIKKRY